jgi:hypothetical protein
MKKFWSNWRKKKLKTIPVAEPNAHLIPEEINEESNDFFEALGISDERKNEIFTYTMLSYGSQDNLCSSISDAAKKAKITHANELVAISYITCKHHLSLQNPGSALLSLLGGGKGE